ncbi:N-acyl-D-amino-acid deacylase family protein [Trujillonella endophytica]|uniref:N-acyl-D-aspartate/D-glutamate deacylase n=1 Tax=Trujillonella endophytica TaxID=673521 RepID=A0A1H8SVA3_9ACTN|nr:amidohydrolase family protein [Trujillella endophytica]SEO82455.1 N-acyl-D-aspartate/D-glutamate deacylase [Trujillella endophytica]
MHDLVIRGGTVVDGTGAPAATADVAVDDGRITEVGRVSARGRQEIEADGALVTPGFVDIHSHYDGQFLWDDRIDPSFGHGVTTVIGGNCGVGFAPVEPQHRRALVELMEGVEDIPDVVIEEGLDWRWRSFPDFLDRLGARKYTMDIGTHISHSPLRVFVMGDRGLGHEAATPEDVALMAKLVREAMDAGAMGFSGARILEHTSSRDEFVPGTFAEDDELLGIARALGESGHGAFQIIPLGANGETYVTKDAGEETRRAEHDRIVRIARTSGRPVVYSLMQFASHPDDWRLMLAESEKAAAEGLRIHPHVGGRGIGALTMLDGYHIFMLRPSYREVAHLPLAERVVALRDPARRARILAEVSDPAGVDPKQYDFVQMLTGRIANIYPLTLPLDYEPEPDRKLGVLAAAAGAPQEAFLYDHYTAGDGRNVCASFYLNYADGSLSALHELLSRPITSFGLADGGAHMKFACDASLPSFLLSFWARDRRRGPLLSVEQVVNKLTRQNADIYGLSDRGVVAPGRRADLNVIDHQRLQLQMPEMVFDLPSGGQRLLQGATGYLATVVAGEITRRNDAETGARPGRLIRSRPA